MAQGVALRHLYPAPAAAPPTAFASPHAPELQRLMGEAATARAAGKLPEAAAALSAARALAPAHPQVAFAAGHVAAAQGEWAGAVEAYEAAAAAEPLGEAGATLRGRALFALGVALHTRARALQAGSPEAVLLLSRAEQALGDAAMAQPADARPRIALASLLRSVGRLDEARERAREAVERDGSEAVRAALRPLL